MRNVYQGIGSISYKLSDTGMWGVSLNGSTAVTLKIIVTTRRMQASLAWVISGNSGSHCLNNKRNKSIDGFDVSFSDMNCAQAHGIFQLVTCTIAFSHTNISYSLIYIRIHQRMSISVPLFHRRNGWTDCTSIIFRKFVMWWWLRIVVKGYPLPLVLIDLIVFDSYVRLHWGRDKMVSLSDDIFKCIFVNKNV